MASPPSQVAPDDLAGLEGARGGRARQLRQPARARAGAPASRRHWRARGPLERAAALAPQATGDGSPHALLAQIAEKEGDRARARRELRAAPDARSHERRGRPAAGGARQRCRRRPTTRLRACGSSPTSIRSTPKSTGSSGRRLLAKNEPPAALVEFQAALALGPPNLAEAHTDVAEALLKLGRKDEAQTAGAAGAQAGADVRARAGSALAAIGTVSGTTVTRAASRPSIAVASSACRRGRRPARRRGRGRALRRHRAGRLGRRAVRHAPSRLARLARDASCAIGSSTTPRI